MYTISLNWIELFEHVNNGVSYPDGGTDPKLKKKKISKTVILFITALKGLKIKFSFNIILDFKYIVLVGEYSFPEYTTQIVNSALCHNITKSEIKFI